MDEHAVETLKKFGFREYEAKVIYALLRLKEADVKLVSKYAEIPRTKAYEVLKSLVKKGVLAEIGTRPLRFAIVDPDGLLDKLYEEKRREVERLKVEVETLKHLLPALSEERKSGENYIFKAGSVDDVVKIIKESVKSPTIVGYTRESERILKGIGDVSYRSPVDFVLTPDVLFIPLNPLGNPQREYVVVAFTNPYVMEMIRRWVEEVLSEGKE